MYDLLTFKGLEQQYKEVLENGYEVITCEQYLKYKKSGSINKIFVNRIDIEASCKKAKELALIFRKLNIKGTFFVRLHADEYNPFSFENYKILKFIKEEGHEIGYHSEVIDMSAIWKEPAEECLRRDIKVLSHMLDIEIKGVASHGGITGYNNLDFWKDRKPSDFNLLYEAYDRQPDFDLFNNSFYVSNSPRLWWKCYDNGELQVADKRTFAEHSYCNHQIIYSLVHPEIFYNEHSYE